MIAEDLGTYGMAKKAQNHASKLRRDKRTPKDLRQGAKDLEVLSAKLVACADSVEQLGIKSIEVDSVTKLTRGCDLVVGFIKAVEKALVDAKP